MELAATPRDTLPHRDGTARVYRFRQPADQRAEAALPVLLMPSVINRWYVLDLRPGASMAEALTNAGLDTFCLDWGIPQDEDRYLEWGELVARIRRAIRVVRRTTGAPRVALLGYCVGATLAGIATALEPDRVGAFVNLAGPFDFSEAGLLARLVDPGHFNVEAIAAAGNISPTQMQSGFLSLRPTSQIAKWVGFYDRAHHPGDREAFAALEQWAADNIPFPAAAYATYIGDLYQRNLLIQRRHRIGGKVVDLSAIRCPVLTVVATRDGICPPRAATALNLHCGSAEKEVLTVGGGHVGAVVGHKASAMLYPALSNWFRSKSCN